jgi:serine protease Do
VNIRTTAKVKTRADLAEGAEGEDPFQELFRRFFGPGFQVPQPNQPNAPRKRPRPESEQQIPRGVGTGFIISTDGYVLTNHHVVDESDEITVTLTDKREFKAKLIGSDQRTDVALLKIEASQLPTLIIGDPNKARVGEWVMAIGSPFGLENTVTAGIVSAKARDTGDYLRFIQTDVAVNPGNSGGPLLNMRGEVIGINSQIISRTGNFAGISLSIPIDEAMRVVEQLRASGKVTRGRIGVQIENVSKDMAEGFGLAKPQGAFVSKVEPNSPAEKAGIQRGDVITKFDDKVIEKSSDLPRLIGSLKPGTPAKLEVWRKGQTRELSIVVGQTEPEKVAKQEAPNPAEKSAASTFGLTVSDLSADKRKELGIREGGVLIDVAQEPASAIGLRKGDVILRVDNVDVMDAKQFNQLLAKAPANKPLGLLVQRGDLVQFVRIRPQSKPQ